MSLDKTSPGRIDPPDYHLPRPAGGGTTRKQDGTEPQPDGSDEAGGAPVAEPFGRGAPGEAMPEPASTPGEQATRPELAIADMPGEPVPVPDSRERALQDLAMSAHAREAIIQQQAEELRSLRQDLVWQAVSQSVLDLIALHNKIERDRRRHDDREADALPLSPRETSDLLEDMSYTVQDALFRMNVERIPTVGQPFERSGHQVVEDADTDDPLLDSIVAAEVQPGYRMRLGESGERTRHLQTAKVVRYRYKPQEMPTPDASLEAGKE